MEFDQGFWFGLRIGLRFNFCGLSFIDDWLEKTGWSAFGVQNFDYVFEFESLVFCFGGLS
jgi:hypothetical protein